MRLSLKSHHSLQCLGMMVIQLQMILEFWSHEFCNNYNRRSLFTLPLFSHLTLTILSSRVLFPISLSTWCSSKLNCSLEIIPGHFGGGGVGCDWPARAFASLCNTSLLLTAQCIKPSTQTTQHTSHHSQCGQD